MSEKQSGIYQIRNLANGKKYIGQTADLEKRKNEHFNSLRRGDHHNRHLQRAYNKYGKENFVFAVLLYCESSELTTYEQALIDSCDSNELYNICLECVDSPLGIILSEETKEKISLANSGENCANSKLIEEQVFEILNLRYNKQFILQDIAEKYNVDLVTIQNICTGKNWNYCYKKFMTQKDNKKESPNSHPNSKMTEKQILEVLCLYYNVGMTQKEVAEKYRITPKSVSSICLGQRWCGCHKKFMTQKNNNKEKPNNYMCGENNHLSKLTEIQVFEILGLYFVERKPQIEIAKIYNVTSSNICLICNGKRWNSCFSQFCEENNINISEEE